MQIVIDIPEEMSIALENGSFGARFSIYELCGYVMNGTPLPKGQWKEIYTESDGSNSWIEFKCPHCSGHFGIESGQYDWHYGDPIPWKACPICGTIIKAERSGE